MSAGVQRVRSMEGVSRSKSFGSIEKGEVLERATSLVEAGDKLFQSKKPEEAIRMYLAGIEELLENAKTEIDLEKILAYHFAVASFGKKYRAVVKQREARQLDLSEILSSSPPLGMNSLSRPTLSIETEKKKKKKKCGVICDGPEFFSIEHDANDDTVFDRWGEDQVQQGGGRFRGVLLQGVHEDEAWRGVQQDQDVQVEKVLVLIRR